MGSFGPLSARSWGSTGWLNGSPGKFRGCGSPVFKVFKGFKHMLLGKAIALCIALKFLSTSAWILVWLVFGYRGGVYGDPVVGQRGQGTVSSAGILFRSGRIVGDFFGVIRFLIGYVMEPPQVVKQDSRQITGVGAQFSQFSKCSTFSTPRC